MSRRDMVLAAVVASLWGFNFVVIDWGMEGIPPLLFVAIRFLVVALAVVVVPRPSTSWRTVVGVGCFMSLGQFGLLYTSMALGLQPGLAALLLQAQVVFTIVIAAGVLRERPTPPQVVGVALGVVGLAVVAVGRGGDAPALAVALALAAALSWAIGNVIARRAGVVRGRGRLGSLSLTVWSAWIDDELAGVGALKALDAERGEIKSMRVDDRFRGAGVGRALLRHIIADARRRRMTSLWLETGTTADFAPAQRLYESEGFELCGPFDDYTLDPFSVFMTRRV